jgi:hypothetical protein
LAPRIVTTAPPAAGALVGDVLITDDGATTTSAP